MTDPREARLERRLFGLLLLLQALCYAWLILSRRIPKGHDTLSVYLLQYLFLGHAGGHGPVLWMPNLAHGVVSTWFSGLQSGLLQNSLLLVGGVPEGTPMGPIFYAGLFLEDLILLVGAWRLGGRFYRRPATRFFVAAAAVGSSLWVTNVYWNHRLVYAVPLIIALLLDVLDTGSRAKLFLAVSLAGLQLLGNAVYIPVLSALTIALFLGLYVFIHRRRLRLTLPLLRPRPVDALWLGGMLLVVAACIVALLQGLGSIRQFHQGRNPDGSVTLDAFLTFPGGLNPIRYLDLLVGVTPSSDYSLYCGLSTVLFAAAAFAARPGRRILPIAAALFILLFFSMGYLSLVGAVAFEALLPLHFVRYVGLAAPLVRLFLILLAGFGFEAFARPPAPGAAGGRKTAGALAILALLGARWIWVRRNGTSDGDPVLALLDFCRTGLAPREESTVRDVAALPGLILAASVLAFLSVRRARPETQRLLLPLLLAVQVLDVFGWRVALLADGTRRPGESELALHQVRPIPYRPSRSPDPMDSPRFRAAGKDDPSYLAAYDYRDPFYHLDPSWSQGYVTQWSPSVDLLLRARAGMALRDDAVAPPGLPTTRPPTPTRPEAYAKAIGEREPKLQVFSAARVAASDEEVAHRLNQPGYRGDVLLVSPSSTAAGGPLDESLLERNDRLPARIDVLEFSGDRLRLRVEPPAEAAQAWLVYCDAWHPDWKAVIDGADVPVERANLAYKAVRLHGGSNLVEFRFDAPWRVAAGRGVGLLSVFWCGVVLAWTGGFLGLGRERAS